MGGVIIVLVCWLLSAIPLLCLKHLLAREESILYDIALATIISFFPVFKYWFVQDLLLVVLAPIVWLLFIFRAVREMFNE